MRRNENLFVRQVDFNRWCFENSTPIIFIDRSSLSSYIIIIIINIINTIPTYSHITEWAKIILIKGDICLCW